MEKNIKINIGEDGQETTVEKIINETPKLKETKKEKVIVRKNMRTMCECGSGINENICCKYKQKRENQRKKIKRGNN